MNHYVKIPTHIVISLAIITPTLIASPHSAEAKQIRSRAAIYQFRKHHPCPATGNEQGACPGYIIDHINALTCGGPDTPDNMQWQTKVNAKLKDRWERIGCAAR
jgi:hypothetical protein